MSVSRVCRKPAISVPPDSSVQQTLEVMTAEKIGAVVVLEDEKAAGIFTRRDAIERVVLKGLPPESTSIASVMTAPFEVMSQDMELPDAMKVMAGKPFNHIPIVDSDEKVVGLATTKPLMKQTIERLSDELGSLEAFHRRRHRRLRNDNSDYFFLT